MKILANELNFNNKFTKLEIEFPVGHNILKLDLKPDYSGDEKLRIMFSVADEFEQYKIFNKKEIRKIYIVGTGVDFRGVTTKENKMFDEDNNEIFFLDFVRIQEEYGYSVFYSEIINKNETDSLSDKEKEDLRQNLLALMNSIDSNNQKIDLKEVVEKINNLSTSQKETLQLLLKM